MSHFDDQAREWEDHDGHSERTGAFADAIREAVDVSAVADALEFGAGTGALSRQVFDASTTVTLADTSAGMIEVACEKLAAAGLEHWLVVNLDVESAPLPETAWDLVISSMTLHHIADIPGLLTRLAPTLRPGGHVALIDLDVEDGSYHRGPEAGHHHHGVGRDDLAGWLTAAGFVDVSFGSPYTVRRADDDGTVREYTTFLAVARRP